jgi:hypothetical protein
MSRDDYEYRNNLGFYAPEITVAEKLHKEWMEGKERSYWYTVYMYKFLGSTEYRNAKREFCSNQKIRRRKSAPCG